MFLLLTLSLGYILAMFLKLVNFNLNILITKVLTYKKKKSLNVLVAGHFHKYLFVLIFRDPEELVLSSLVKTSGLMNICSHNFHLIMMVKGTGKIKGLDARDLKHK